MNRHRRERLNHDTPSRPRFNTAIVDSQMTMQETRRPTLNDTATTTDTTGTRTHNLTRRATSPKIQQTPADQIKQGQAGTLRRLPDMNSRRLQLLNRRRNRQEIPGRHTLEHIRNMPRHHIRRLTDNAIAHLEHEHGATLTPHPRRPTTPRRRLLLPTRQQRTHELQSNRRTRQRHRNRLLQATRLKQYHPHSIHATRPHAPPNMSKNRAKNAPRGQTRKVSPGKHQEQTSARKPSNPQVKY